MTEADSRIVIIPPTWWAICLVGLQLPKDHPAIQVKAHKKDVPDNWRTQRVGKGKLAASAFDNALRAGQRERAGMWRQRPGETQRWAENNHRIAIAERENVLCLWMAGWEEVPYIVRPAMHEWSKDRLLIQDIRKMDIEPECWEFDETSLDRVPAPSYMKVAA